jgi:hypothetical protein
LLAQNRDKKATNNVNPTTLSGWWWWWWNTNYEASTCSAQEKAGVLGRLTKYIYVAHKSVTDINAE